MSPTASRELDQLNCSCQHLLRGNALSLLIKLKELYSLSSASTVAKDQKLGP